MSLQTDITKLTQLGIIKDPAYWTTNAVYGKTCKGELAAQLIANIVSKINGGKIINI